MIRQLEEENPYSSEKSKGTLVLVHSITIQYRESWTRGSGYGGGGKSRVWTQAQSNQTRPTPALT